MPLEKAYAGATQASVGDLCIPRCWLNFREFFWSVALSLAFKALLGWEMFSLLISNQDPPLGIGQSVEEKGFVDRTLYAHYPPCCFRLFIQHFCGTFLYTGPCAWQRRPQRWARFTRSSCLVGEAKQVTITFVICDKATAEEDKGAVEG